MEQKDSKIMQQWTFAKNQELRQSMFGRINECLSALAKTLTGELNVFFENQVGEVLESLVGKEVTVVYSGIRYEPDCIDLFTHTGIIKSLSPVMSTKPGCFSVTFSPTAPTGSVHYTAIREIKLEEEPTSSNKRL